MGNDCQMLIKKGIRKQFDNYLREQNAFKLAITKKSIIRCSSCRGYLTTYFGEMSV